MIDPHYKVEHPDIDDELILRLVQRLDGKEFQPDARHGEWQFVLAPWIGSNIEESSIDWSGANKMCHPCLE